MTPNNRRNHTEVTRKAINKLYSCQLYKKISNRNEKIKNQIVGYHSVTS